MLGATGPSCLVTMLAVFDSVTTYSRGDTLRLKRSTIQGTTQEEATVYHPCKIVALSKNSTIYLHQATSSIIINKLSSYQVSLFLSFGCQAIETLKGFEKKDSKVQSTAATNLSFLYFLVCFFLCIFCLRFLLQLGRIMS